MTKLNRLLEYLRQRGPVEIPDWIHAITEERRQELIKLENERKEKYGRRKTKA